MTLKQWKLWEKLRKSGKCKFILLYGGVIAGFIVALLATLIGLYFDSENYWSVCLLVNFSIFSLLGMIIAGFTWNISETKFLSENPPEHSRIHHSGHRK
jgi:hypothetical protein